VHEGKDQGVRNAVGGWQATVHCADCGLGLSHGWSPELRGEPTWAFCGDCIAFQPADVKAQAYSRHFY
jgi:hypothetical protein